jgi:hypothetical protein
MPAKFNPQSLELDIPMEPVFQPKMVWIPGMATMFTDVPESVKDIARKFRADGWKYYAVSQQRGRCYYRPKVITIPQWVIEQKDITKKIWYISHEISHASAGWRAAHGPEFMETLKQICPENSIHHELGYKPRNAAAAGIGFKLLEL